MGIRSDVAIALKNNVLEGLSAESKKTLDEWFGQTSSVTKEGVLFYEESIKWYNESYDDLIQLYAELMKFDDEDYLIVQACHDYPSSDEGDLGGWYENPWEIHRSWSVSVEWDEGAFGDEVLDNRTATG